jgi:hypothetical protein
MIGIRGCTHVARDRDQSYTTVAKLCAWMEYAQSELQMIIRGSDCAYCQSSFNSQTGFVSLWLSRARVGNPRISVRHERGAAAMPSVLDKPSEMGRNSTGRQVTERMASEPVGV